ncbi:MAG TPA: hypothetical protein VFZ58_00255 [Candidatus Saccharimonadales bacterium]
MAEVEINFSNLNFDEKTMRQATGSFFRDFLAEAGYDGAEITLLRRVFMRRLLGKYAAEITRGLHVPFPGRTFPEALGELLFDIGNKEKRHQNIAELKFATAMPEVSRALEPMASYQKRIGKGSDQASSQLDAVLYPFSGENGSLIDLDDKTAPFKHRTFQLTAEVLHRWGIPLNQDMPHDELFKQLCDQMVFYGFHALTLDSLHARRQYKDENNELYGLPPDFVEYVAMKGLFINAHVSVGRVDVVKGGALLRATTEEAELLAAADESFWKTQQGEWLQLALRHYSGEGPFRMTTEEPNSCKVDEDGKVVNLAQYRASNEMLRNIEQAA